MTSRLLILYVRYGILILSCSLVALFPWVISAISDPLPADLQQTGTLLAITRTARLDPELADRLVLSLGFTSTPSSTALPTITNSPTITLSPSASATQTATPTLTPTWTSTPFPDVRGVVNSVINTYTCPGMNFKRGKLEYGAVFHVLGWDQSVEDGETITWILIDDGLDRAQRWVQDSKFITLSEVNYQQFVPRAACRSA